MESKKGLGCISLYDPIFLYFVHFYGILEGESPHAEFFDDSKF